MGKINDQAGSGLEIGSKQIKRIIFSSKIVINTV